MQDPSTPFLSFSRQYGHNVWNCGSCLSAMKGRPGELHTWWLQHHCATESISRIYFLSEFLVVRKKKKTTSLFKPLYFGFFIICSLKHFWFIGKTTLFFIPSWLQLIYYLLSNDSLKCKGQTLPGPFIGYQQWSWLEIWCLGLKSHAAISTDAQPGSQEYVPATLKTCRQLSSPGWKS